MTRPSHPSRSQTSRPRVIVVAKRSNISKLTDGHMDARASRLLRTKNAAVKKWRPAHEQHVRTLEVVEATLSKAGAEVLVLHGSSASFDARGAALVVTVGGDGTLLAASHNLFQVPILGVNSAPRYSVGFFCAARGRSLKTDLRAALEGELSSVKLQRMKVSCNQQVRADRILNEALFCHSEPAATSRYILRVGAKKEEQRSSGLWVGPAAGSTAAIRSAGGRVLPLTSSKLQCVVREPYSAHGAKLRLLKEVVDSRGKFRVLSKMESARIYLDGPYRELVVHLGDEICFERSAEPLTVLALTQRNCA